MATNAGTFCNRRLPFGSKPTFQARRSSSYCVTALQKPRLSYIGRPYSLSATTNDGITTIYRDTEQSRLRSPSITKTDEQFQEEYLEFVWGTDGLDLVELNDLFDKVCFPKRDLQKLRMALDNTFSVVWVRSTRNSRWAKLGQLLGFARAFSDQSLTATIWDVAVHPAWQRGGLGRALMERLVASLVDADIQTICLYAEPNVVPMYEKLGFTKDPFGVKGMAFQAEDKPGKALLASTA